MVQMTMDQLPLMRLRIWRLTELDIPKELSALLHFLLARPFIVVNIQYVLRYIGSIRYDLLGGVVAKHVCDGASPDAMRSC